MRRRFLYGGYDQHDNIGPVACTLLLDVVRRRTRPPGQARSFFLVRRILCTRSHRAVLSGRFFMCGYACPEKALPE